MSKDDLNGRDRARAILMATRDLCASERTKSAVKLQAQMTLDLMLLNQTSHPENDDGTSPQVKVPWWPRPKSEAQTLRDKTRREDLLRWRAWEHGLLAFMYGLVDDKLIAPLRKQDVDALTRGHMQAILYEAEEPRKLVEILKLIGNGNAKHREARDKYVIPLAELRLLESAEMTGPGAQTAIGFRTSCVAEAFIEQVYVPLVNAMDVNYRELPRRQEPLPAKQPKPRAERKSKLAAKSPRRRPPRKAA